MLLKAKPKKFYYAPAVWDKAATGGGGGNVTPDVLGTAKYQANSNNFNYSGLTITGGLTNPGLVCVLARAHGSNDVEAGSAVTWGGTPMTLIKKQNNGTTFTAFIFGLRNPASGNQTLNVSGTNVAADNFVNCVSFSNVNPASDVAAFPNTAGANNATSLSVTSAAGHVGVAIGMNGSSNGTILGTTVINDAANGTVANCLADYVASVGATVAVGTSTNQIAIAGIDVSN